MDKVVDNLTNIELSSSVKYHLEETYENYIKFLSDLFSNDKKLLKNFLITLKNREIVNNQETELEESFLIELYALSQRKNSIDIMMDHFNDGKITDEELKKIHRVVIKGSSDDIVSNYDWRKDNEKWVGNFTFSGNKRIDYMPPDYRKIPELVNKTLDFLNEKSKNDILNNPLIKPFIVHAVLAYIQPFGNGNTRAARVIQHGKIWQLTNQNTEFDLPLPAIYLSKNYLQTRAQYRDLIKEVAADCNWDSWINYNLNMVDEQLYFSSNNLKKHLRR